MNKKDKEQTELNRLLQECIMEQKNIGLCPTDNIEIYIEKDPISNFKCPKKCCGCCNIFGDRKAILIKRFCFNFYPINELKTIIHHELIHLNLKENNYSIQHIKDWLEFTALSKKINNHYGINPLVSYAPSCFKDNKINYNGVAKCPRCGLACYYLIDYSLDYSFNGKCSNCGGKLVYKKKTSE